MTRERMCVAVLAVAGLICSPALARAQDETPSPPAPASPAPSDPAPPPVPQEPPPPPELKPGLFRGIVTLDPEAEGASFQTFRVRVGPDVVGFQLELDARADLDLFVARRPMEDYEQDALVRSVESTASERILLARDTEPMLQDGDYFVDVAYARPDPPRLRNGRALRSIPFRLRLRVFRTRTDGTLAFGGRVRGSITPDDGPFRTYVVDVPEGADTLRLDLVADGEDLNLRVRRDKPMVSSEDAEAVAETGLASEVLVLSAGSNPPLKPGRYFVDVVDAIGLPWPIAFELRASASAAVPAGLQALPALPTPRSALDRAIFGTVELLSEDGGGSGVLVSPEGWLLTNYHVVQTLVEGGGELGGPLFVSLSLDRRGAPVALFQAKVLASDQDLDLALVRCVAGRYGQPLPKGFRFPTVPLGDAASLAHGDDLWMLGYPSAGGSGSRPPITLSRGIVSGFERRGQTVHIKTDAEIAAGNSGGACLDAAFGLVGFPTETISDDDTHGQLAYVRPIWLVPAAWWRKAGIDPDRIRQP